MADKKFPKVMYKLGDANVPCILVASHYIVDKNIAIEAFVNETTETEFGTIYNGEVMGTLTVNLPGKPLSDGAVFLDKNNCPDVETMLKDANLGKATGVCVHSGFCEYPEWQFSDAEIKSMLDEV